jgi:hypothetical protein
MNLPGFGGRGAAFAVQNPPILSDEEIAEELKQRVTIDEEKRAIWIENHAVLFKDKKPKVKTEREIIMSAFY